MAKKAMIEKERKRQALVKQYAEIRRELKKKRGLRGVTEATA